MNKRLAVVVVGIGLTVACSGKQAPDAPVVPPPSEPAPATDPPDEPAPMPPTNPPPPLPSWDEAVSAHPIGATNPPFPVLVVLPHGARCFKQWVSPMQPPGPATVDRVSETIPDGSTEIECPPRARELLEPSGPK